MVAVLLYSLLHGLRRGPLTGLLSTVGLIVGFVVASAWYPALADMLTLSLHLDKAWVGTGAFLVLFLVVYVIIGVVVTILLWARRMSMSTRLMGALVGVLKGAVLATLLLVVVLASPLGPMVHDDANHSRIAPYAVQGYQSTLKVLLRVLPSTVHLPDADSTRF